LFFIKNHLDQYSSIEDLILRITITFPFVHNV